MYVIVADLRIKEGMSAEFWSAARENAANSLELEPGCSRFDVVRDTEDDAHVVFVEHFDDQAAFEAHRLTDHYRRWREAVPDILDPVDGQSITYASTE